MNTPPPKRRWFQDLRLEAGLIGHLADYYPAGTAALNQSPLIPTFSPQWEKAEEGKPPKSVGFTDPLYGLNT